MDPRYRKIIKDLWGNRSRTILVMLSIAVGVLAIGTIAGTYAIMDRGMTENSQDVNITEIKLGTSTNFDKRFVESVRKMPEVESAEGRQSVRLRLKVGENDWKELEVFATDDFENMQVSRVRPEAGAWPPSNTEREMLLERDYVAEIAVNIGDVVLIEMPDGTQRQLPVTGIVHDLDPFPTGLSGTIYGYVSFDTLEWLGGEKNTYSDLFIVPTNRADAVHTQETINLLQDRLEENGHIVIDIDKTISPGVDMIQTIVQAVLSILGILSVLALILSGFLVTNMITALLAQQTRQTGIMKTIGAGAGQILGMYILIPIIFGVIVLIITVPLAAISARALSSYLLDIVNFTATDYSIPMPVLLLELLMGLAIPVLASLVPVISASRISIREAVTLNGLSTSQFGSSGFDKFIQNSFGFVSALSIEAVLSIRNMFRRRQRLLLTLTTLILGSAIFMGVFSVRSSMENTLDEASQYWQYDVEVDFRQPYRIDRIQQEAMNVPGVNYVEGWGTYRTRRVRADRSESTNISIIAPAADTELLKPILLEGRWLSPDDRNQIVIDTEVTRRETDIKVGDDITLKIKGKDQQWEVVGIVKGQLRGPIAYMSYQHYSETIGKFESAVRMVVAGDQHDEDAQKALGRTLEQKFSSAGLQVSALTTVSDLREETAEQFNIFTLLLLCMAIIIAIVGGLGLMGAMSLNVIERTREIGIMQTIGATSGSVMKVFIIEGVLIGILSWFIGSFLAVPLSSYLSNAAGQALLQAPLNYSFSTVGVAIWLVAMVLMGAIASFWPARNASLLTIREIMAFE